MSSKIIRNVKADNVFKMREFSTVERGEHNYNMRSFADDEELSVQDKIVTADGEEPETIIDYEDEVTEKDYWPPSRLAKAEDDIVCEKVELPEGKIGQGFIESPVFSDSNAELQDVEAPAVVYSSNNNESSPVSEEIIENKVYKNDTESKNILENESSEDFKPVLSEELISEEELNKLKNQLQEYKDKVEEAENKAKEMEALKLTVEKALLERDKQLEAKENEFTELQNSIPEKVEQAKNEGKTAGFDEAKTEFAKSYEAEKADYMSKIDNFISEALKKIDEINNSLNSIDEQIPAMVIGYVKTIIGSERKINDEFALKLIKENLSKLSGYRDISFSVNPDDLETVKNGLADYKVESDVSIPKGGVVVHSKSGEITLNVDNMIKDLENEINAQFRVIEKDKASS